MDEEVTKIPDGKVIIASGPLTSDDFQKEIGALLGTEYLHFFDAVAPIVSAETIDMSSAFLASRYDKGTPDYINCPMNEQEYKDFIRELVSAEEYDKVLQAYNQAKEERSAAQEALEVIRDGVSSSNAGSSSTLVRSTITGLILDIPVKVGNSVIQANTMNDGTTVATVADMSDLIFNGLIDETEVGALVAGMPMKITIGALPDYSSEATLEYISPKATESNGANQFQIKAAIVPCQTHTIRAGYSANAEIVLQEAKGVLSVPESALEFSADSVFVYLMGEPQVFERIPITTGMSDGINIQVLSGLKAGQVVRGTQNIEE